MKVNGVEAKREDAVYGPVSFQRGIDEDGNPVYLDFLAVPLWDRKEFDELCPAPTPPVKGYKPDGSKTYDEEAPDHLAKKRARSAKWWGYLVLTSLAPSNIEWESVSIDDPDTWDKVEDELGPPNGILSYYEFGKVMDLVNQANALDQAKLEANLQSFWQRRAGSAQQSNSQDGGPKSSSDGGPV